MHVYTHVAASHFRFQFGSVGGSPTFEHIQRDDGNKRETQHGPRQHCQPSKNEILLLFAVVVVVAVPSNNPQIQAHTHTHTGTDRRKAVRFGYNKQHGWLWLRMYCVLRVARQQHAEHAGRRQTHTHARAGHTGKNEWHLRSTYVNTGMYACVWLRDGPYAYVVRFSSAVVHAVWCMATHIHVHVGHGRHRYVITYTTIAEACAWL